MSKIHVGRGVPFMPARRRARGVGNGHGRRRWWRGAVGWAGLLCFAVMVSVAGVAVAVPSGPLRAVPADRDGGRAPGADGAAAGARPGASRRTASAGVPVGRPDEPVPESVGQPVPRVGRVWPVGTHPAVVRGWDPPVVPYGPGHRGVDLAAAPGAPVRAVAPGKVAFAGPVAGRGVVSLDLDDTGTPALRTTYDGVRPAVRKGDEVSAGQVVAFLEPRFGHCPEACLHWGLRRAAGYLNPLSLLPPEVLRPAPSRLLPVSGVPEER